MSTNGDHPLASPDVLSLDILVYSQGPRTLCPPLPSLPSPPRELVHQ